MWKLAALCFAGISLFTPKQAPPIAAAAAQGARAVRAARCQIVAAESGLPLEGVRIYATRDRQDLLLVTKPIRLPLRSKPLAVTDDGGRFELDPALPGETILTFCREGRAPQRKSVKSLLRGRHLSLLTGVRIEGRVRAAAPGCVAYATYLPSLETLEPNAFRQLRSVSPIAADGTFSWDDLPRGCIVTIEVWDPGSLQVVAKMEQPMFQRTGVTRVHLSALEDPKDNGEMEGVLLDPGGMPAVGSVSYFRFDVPTLRQVETDSQGNFRLTGLAPGTYALQGLQEGPGAHGASFTVVASTGARGLDLLLREAGAVHLEVIPPDGMVSDQGWAEIHGPWDSGRGRLQSFQGRHLRLDGLLPGEYSLVVHLEDLVGLAGPFTVDAGSTLEPAIILKPAGTVLLQYRGKELVVGYTAHCDGKLVAMGSLTPSRPVSIAAPGSELAIRMGPIGNEAVWKTTSHPVEIGGEVEVVCGD